MKCYVASKVLRYESVSYVKKEEKKGGESNFYSSRTFFKAFKF